MIVLLPLSRFRVTYDVAIGRPYSRLEALVLRAVHEGTTTVEGLEPLFGVHRRLLVEALVTLTQAGWVALGSSDSQAFVLTSEGDAACKESGTPKSRNVENRNTPVVMERLTGACIANSAVRYVSNREIEKLGVKGIKLRTCVGSNRLSDADVYDFLPRRQGEWINWIGPIDQDSKLNHWLPVSVDLKLGRIVGIPEEWTERVAPRLLDEARRFAAKVDPQVADAMLDETVVSQEKGLVRDDADVPRLPQREWPTVIRPDDLLYSQRDHVRQLRAALADAQSSLLVMSAFLSLSTVQFFKGNLLKALQRGVNVDLMWGYATSGDDERTATAWIKELAQSTKQAGAKGVLRLNHAASKSHAKLLIWDGSQGFQGCLGSFNWLSTATKDAQGNQDDALTNVSLRFAHPALVSAVARRAAALWDSARGQTLSSTGARWRQIAATLDAESAGGLAQSTDTNATIELIADTQHEDLLRGCLRATERTLHVASHKLGPIASTRLVSATDRKREGAHPFFVHFGESNLAPDELAQLQKLVQESRGVLKQVPFLHAKLLAREDLACVTSYNFLSSDPFGTAHESRELGIIIRGSEPCGWLFNRLSDL